LLSFEKMAAVSSSADVDLSGRNSSKVTEDGAVRMTKLRSGLNKTVESSIKALNYTVFKEHFNPKSRDEIKMVREVHVQFEKKAVALISEEVVLMLREENVEELLLKLDELCKRSSSRSGQVLWRPKGVPVDDVTAQLLPVLVMLRRKLKAVLDDADAETDRMKRAVLERRRLICSLKTEIAENVKLLSE